MASSQPFNPKNPGKDTYGTFVLIKHVNGFSTLYAHLSSSASGITVFSTDDRYNAEFASWTPVRKGDVIGFVGLSGVVTTGRSHLHFEVARNTLGTYSGHVAGRVDPYDIRQVALFYPPSGPKFTSCGQNFFWKACPLSPKEIVLQPGPDEGKDIWTTSVYSYASCSYPGPGGGAYDENLRIGGWGDWYYSLLEFDLTDLPAYARTASLQLFCYSDNNGTPTPIYLDRIESFWWDWQTTGTGCDYQRLWWNDRPMTVPWNGILLPSPTVGDWYSIDITDLYNAWRSGTYPNYGLQLRPASVADNFDVFYSSRFNVNPMLRPKLVINQ
jgi:hypothetical protein